MSRKKVVKTNKAKKTARRSPVSSIDQIEKSFKAAPNLLVAHFRKEITTLKSQEKKLAETWKKAVALTKAIQNKCNALAKTPATPKVKKQLTAAKLGLQKASKATAAMDKQIQEIKKLVQTLANKQAKFTMLHKEINKLEKEWTAKTKANLAAPAKKRKAHAAPQNTHHAEQSTFQHEMTQENEVVEIEAANSN